MSFKSIIEEKSGYKFSMFIPLGKKSKIDGGIKYTIKYYVSEEYCILAKVFEPSYHSGLRTTCEGVDTGIPLISI